MKNKKGQTIYSEAIYFPCEFRRGYSRTGQCVFSLDGKIWMYSMPAILTGWVQNEVHLQYGYQSLQ